MGDALERFVRENRDSFDSDLPGDQVWSKIRTKTKVTRTDYRPVDQFWRIAAVILLISTVYLSVDRLMQSDGQDEFVQQAMEFEQVENYYNQLISDKKEEIASYDKNGLKRSFLMEIERLDQMYDELKTTYKKQNAAERVLDAMINNLKLQMDILNQQLEILKRLNESEDESESIQSI